MENKIFKIYNLITEEMCETPFRYEHALQEYIQLHPEILKISKHLQKPEITFSEKQSTNSRYDLVVYYKDANETAIVEIKRAVINDKALEQLLGYLENETDLKSKLGILVGTSITMDVQKAVQESKNLYAIIIHRYDQNKEEVVSTTIFTPKISLKDRTKYILFNLQGDVITQLGKGQLMYEIIKSYVHKHPDTSFQDLKDKFPDSLAGRGKNVKMPIIHLDNFTTNDQLRGRYFKEPLQCRNAEILICNQWGIGNIERMINKATELGMQITIQK